MNEKWIITTGVGSITAIGVIIGLILILTQSIRLDESQTMWMAGKSIMETLKLTGEDVHVPLYNLLAHFIINLAGGDVRYVRGISLLFYGLSIPSLYILVKENINKRAAILASGLLTFSPFVIWFSAEARMYSLLLLTTIINHIFFLRIIRSNGEKGKLWYFLSGIAGIFGHYFFWLNIFSQGVFLALRFGQKFINRNTETEHKNLKRKVYWVFGNLVAGWLMVLSPWIAFAISQGGASNTQPLISKPTSYNVVVAMVNFLFGFHETTIQNILVSLWPLTAIGLLVAFTRKNMAKGKNIDYFAISAILPIALVFLVSMIKPVFLSRYLMFVVPSWMIILAWIIADQKKWLAKMMVVTLIATMSGLLLNQTVSAKTPVKEGYEQLVRYLEREAKSSDVVAITAAFTIYPIEYNYKGSARLTTIPEWNRYEVGAIPPFEEEKMVNQIKEMTKIYQSVFIVFSYDQGYEDVILNYMDHNYEMINKKKISADIEVREYRLRY